MTAKFKAGNKDNLQHILTTLANGGLATLPSNIPAILYVYQFNSKDWEIQMRQTLNKSKNACGICRNNTTPLPIHHIWGVSSPTRLGQKLLGLIALCPSCHAKIHHPNYAHIDYILRKSTHTKFHIGDRVRFVTDNPKKRPAQFNLTDYRRRSRAIIGAYYFPDNKCAYYELSGIPRTFGLFRSYSLKLVTPKESHTRGTPRLKRKYVKKTASHKV